MGIDAFNCSHRGGEGTIRLRLPEKWQGSVKSGFEITKNEIVSLVSREAHT